MRRVATWLALGYFAVLTAAICLSVSFGVES
jgi:uncharacterized membrane protein YgaE (UPF0421/DUF939 family)